MSYTEQGKFPTRPGLTEAEATLRLIASLPAPDGLEGRVHSGLRSAPRSPRILAWPGVSPLAGGSMASGWLRGAAAAAIVFVVAGGGWGIYSRVQPGQPAHGVAGPRMAAPGSFSQTGVVRRPLTLEGPAIPAPVKAVTPSPKALTKPALALPPKAKAAAGGKASVTPSGPAAK
jgi:hypothetical protein